MGIKVKVNHRDKTVVLNAEAKAALKRSGPSNFRLKQMLLGNDLKSMANSAEVRWLAAAVLFYNEYDFTPEITLRQKTPRTVK